MNKSNLSHENMDFISQYLLANSGTMVPRRFTMWSALSILGMAIGRKVYVDHAHYILYPGVYLCLVGEPASRKTTAMSQARDMFYEVFPDYPSGVSVTSREDIVKFMSSDQCLRTFNNEAGEMVEWRPLANFINEFTNFLSFNPKGMIEFLTDVYDTKFFKSSTIKRGQEFILHPYVSILACTTPNNIIKYLKADIIGGGFSRRIIFVYETILPDKITFPAKSIEAYAAEKWCKDHLLKISSLSGPFKWTPEARHSLDVWYRAIPPSVDPVLSGYFEAKDVLVQKLAMCLAAADIEPQLTFTQSNITAAIAFLESNEDNLARLTVAVGRNELAVPQSKMLQLLKDRGGMMSEKEWHKTSSNDMGEREYNEVKSLLQSTDQAHFHHIMIEGKPVSFIINHDRYLSMVKSGEIKIS